MKIRPMVLADTHPISDLLNAVIKIGGTTAYETPLPPEYFEQFFDIPDPKIFLHVAQERGEILGLQWMEPYAPPEDHIGGISTFTKPGLAQKGVASQLFPVTLRASKSAGYILLNATIRADNSGGLRYYSKMGFADFDVIEAVPLKDGTPVDRVRKRFTL